MQFFIQQIFEYLSQLKKYHLDIEFAMTIHIEGQLLAWPLPVLSDAGSGSTILPVAKSYTFQTDVAWEGRRIGYYYWKGSLDSNQKIINQLLIDNMVTKIALQSQINHNLSCGVGVLDSAIQAIEAKDHYTRGHSDRVSQLTLKLANLIDLNMTKRDVEIASKLHDIGKIGVSELVLGKPTALSGSEMEIIRKHPDIGANILKPLPIFTHLVPAIRHHHEKYDGTGYPEKLAGSDIPLLSRIIAVADTYDALTSNRPYRSALPAEQALKIIDNARSTQLDPAIVDTFLSFNHEQFKPNFANLN